MKSRPANEDLATTESPPPLAKQERLGVQLWIRWTLWVLRRRSTRSLGSLPSRSGRTLCRARSDDAPTLRGGSCFFTLLRRRYSLADTGAPGAIARA